LEADHSAGSPPWLTNNKWRAVNPTIVNARDGTCAFYVTPVKRHGKPRVGYSLSEWEAWHIKLGKRVSYVILHGGELGLHHMFTPKDTKLPDDWPVILHDRVGTSLRYDPEILSDHYYLSDYTGLPEVEISDPFDKGFEYDPTKQASFDSEMLCDCPMCASESHRSNMRIGGRSPAWGVFTPQANPVVRHFDGRNMLDDINLDDLPPLEDVEDELLEDYIGPDAASVGADLSEINALIAVKPFEPEAAPAVFLPPFNLAAGVPDRENIDWDAYVEDPPAASFWSTIGVATIYVLFSFLLNMVMRGAIYLAKAFYFFAVTMLRIHCPKFCGFCRYASYKTSRFFSYVSRTAAAFASSYGLGCAIGLALVLVTYILPLSGVLGYLFVQVVTFFFPPLPEPAAPDVFADIAAACHIWQERYNPEIRAVLIFVLFLAVLRTTVALYRGINDLIEFVEDCHSSFVITSIRLVRLMRRKETYICFVLISGVMGYLAPTLCFLLIECIELVLRCLSFLAVFAGVSPILMASIFTVLSLTPLLAAYFYVEADNCTELRGSSSKRVILTKEDKSICLHYNGGSWARPFSGRPHRLNFKSEARLNDQSYRRALRGEHHFAGVVALYKDIVLDGRVERVLHGHCIAMTVPSGPHAGSYLLIVRHLFEKDASAGWDPMYTTDESIYFRRWQSSTDTMKDIPVVLSQYKRATMTCPNFVASVRDFSIYKVPDVVPGTTKRFELFALLGLKAISINDFVGLRGACVMQAYQGDSVVVTRGEITPASTFESKYGLILHSANTEPGFSGLPIFVATSTSATAAYKVAGIHIGTQVISGKTWNVGLSAPAIVYLLRKLGTRPDTPFAGINVGVTLLPVPAHFAPEASPGNRDNTQADYDNDDRGAEFWDGWSNEDVSDGRDYDPDDYDDNVPLAYRDEETAVDNREVERRDDAAERDKFNTAYATMMDEHSSAADAQRAAAYVANGGGYATRPGALTGKPDGGWGEANVSPVLAMTTYARLMPGVDSDLSVARYWLQEFDRSAGINVRPLKEIRDMPICEPYKRMPINDIFKLVIAEDNLDNMVYFKQWSPDELFYSACPIFERLRAYRESGTIDWATEVTEEIIGPAEDGARPVFQQVGKSKYIHCSGHTAYTVDQDFLDSAQQAGIHLTENGHPLFSRPHADASTVKKTLREQAKKLRRGNLDAAKDDLRGNTSVYDGFPTDTKSNAYCSLADHFDECINAFDPKKSNGFAGTYSTFFGPKQGCMTGTNKIAMIEIVLASLAMMSSLGHKAIGTMYPEELVAYGLSDPKAIFPKDENIPWAKASLGFCRTIWNVSTPFNLLTNVLHRNWAKAQIKGYQQGTVTSLFTGVGHHPAGKVRIGEAIAFLLDDPADGGKGEGLVTKDCSAFDLTVRRDLQMVSAYAQIEHSAPLKNPEKGTDLRYYNKDDQFNPHDVKDRGLSQQFVDYIHSSALLRSAHVFVLNDQLFATTIAGIIASGDALTSSSGSEVQTIAHRLCGVQKTASGSDDNISRQYGPENSGFDKDRYVKFGFNLKFLIVSPPEGPLSFNSLTFTQDESGTWNTAFENLEKLYVNARFHTPNQEVADSDAGRARWSSYKGLLLGCGDESMWTCMVQAFLGVGIVIDHEMPATFDVSPTASEWVDEQDFACEGVVPPIVSKRTKIVAPSKGEASASAPKVDSESHVLKEQIASLQAAAIAKSAEELAETKAELKELKATLDKMCRPYIGGGAEPEGKNQATKSVPPVGASERPTKQKKPTKNSRVSMTPEEWAKLSPEAKKAVRAEQVKRSVPEGDKPSERAEDA